MTQMEVLAIICRAIFLCLVQFQVTRWRNDAGFFGLYQLGSTRSWATSETARSISSAIRAEALCVCVSCEEKLFARGTFTQHAHSHSHTHNSRVPQKRFARFAPMFSLEKLENFLL